MVLVILFGVISFGCLIGLMSGPPLYEYDVTDITIHGELGETGDMYRSVGVYQLRPVHGMTSNTVTSYSEYQYMTESEAQAHKFTTDTIGQRVWIQAGREKIISNSLTLDGNKHNKEAIDKKNTALAICTGVFGAPSILLGILISMSPPIINSRVVESLRDECVL